MKRGTRWRIEILYCCSALVVGTTAQAQGFTEAQSFAGAHRAALEEIERRKHLSISTPAHMLLIRDLPPINPSTGRPYPTMGAAPELPLKALRDHVRDAHHQADRAGDYWSGVRARSHWVNTASIAAATQPELVPFAAVGGIVASVSSQIAENAAQQAAEQHYQTVKRLVEGYAATLSAENQRRIFGALGPYNPDFVREQALVEIGAGLDDLFREVNPKSLSKDAIVAATPTMMGAIRDGLVNARLLQKEDAAVLSGRIDRAERAMAGSHESLARLAHTVKQTNGAVRDIQLMVPELKNSLQVTNAILLARMSATEQLRALAAGMDLGIDPATRRQLIQELGPRAHEEQRVQRVRLTQQTANDVATVASTAVNVARAVGVDIPHDVDQALTLAHGLFNVAVGFSINPIAGIGAVNGVLNAFAGPQSPTADPRVLKALREIQEDLGNIKALQQETLDKLEALDARLAAQHAQVMEQMERIATQISTLVDFAYSDVHHALEQCANFERRLSDHYRRGGGRYESLVEIFNNTRLMQEEYMSCREALNRYSMVSNQVPHPIFTHGLATEGKISTVTHSTFYKPVVDLMNAIYVGQPDWCTDHVRLLTTLSQSMDGHLHAMAACSDQQETLPKMRLSFGDVALVSYRETLNKLIHHDALMSSPTPDVHASRISLIERFRRHHSLIAPFHELMPSHQWETRLLTVAELQQRPSETVLSPEAAERGARLLDLVALAAAQESMMAGVGMYPEIWAAIHGTLQKAEPKAAKLQIAQDWDDSSASPELLRSCDISDLNKLDSRRLACLFTRHPQLLANTIVWRLREAMREEGRDVPDRARLALYGAAQTHHSQDLLNRATGAGPSAVNWTLDRTGTYGFVFRRDVDADKDPGNGAYFKYRSEDGSDLYLRAPGEHEIFAGLIRYRPQAYQLMQTRQALYEEHLLYRLHKPGANAPALSPEQRGFIAFHALNGMVK